MEERIHRVQDHIPALRAEASPERLVRAGRLRSPHGRRRPTRAHLLRRRAGHALMALGALVEGRQDAEGCPGGIAAARP